MGGDTTPQRTPHQVTIRFLTRNSTTGQERVELHVQNIPRYKPPAKTIYTTKLSFRYEGDMKAFPDKQKLREFIAARPVLQEMLKEMLLPETKRQEHTKH